MYSGNIRENIFYDHLPNFIILESEPLKQTNKPLLVRDVKNFDQNAFTKELFDLHLSSQIYNNVHILMALSLTYKLQNVESLEVVS